MGDCPAKYKNLNRIQSFSEQRYATVQLLEQICMNEEYLKQHLEEINYLTPPAVRDTHSPILVDPMISYGYQINQDRDNTVTFFNSEPRDLFTIDFDEDYHDYIDVDKSDVEFVNVVENNVHQGQCELPSGETVQETLYCSSFLHDDDLAKISNYWYVGYDKNKNYELRDDWVKNWNDAEIPSIARAQTFTTPAGLSNSNVNYITSVDIPIKNIGTKTSNWGSPLYVRIFPTYKKKVMKTEWDPILKKSVPVYENGERVIEEKYYPRETGPLAIGMYDPNTTVDGLVNIKFNKKLAVGPNEVYALVISSPLSHHSHCPCIGGWSRDSGKDKYSKGDAFLSEQNGRYWKIYGKNDDSVKRLSDGAYTPLDFAFRIHIDIHRKVYKNDAEYVLYSKPIFSNPIKSVLISSHCKGDEGTDNDISVVFEVSHNMRSWEPLDTNKQVFFERDSGSNEYPRVCFIRARLHTSSVYKTPSIQDITVVLDTELPSEMYVRTLPYTPRTTPMLGANVWGRVFAPFTVEPSVSGSVEIIPNELSSESFDVISAFELSNYVDIEGLDVSKITDEDMDVRYHYLIDNPSALELLRKEKVYVKPAQVDNEWQYFSFEKGVQLTNSPAYPVKCVMNSLSDDARVGYSEWADYAVDYDNDIINFHHDDDQDVIFNMPVGKLTFEYNKVFIQDLTNAEVGRRDDGEGLILDYFKEDILVDESNIESRSIPLRVAPVCPIRKLIVNEEEKVEGVDFTVDYINQVIKFPIVDSSNHSILNINDVVSMVYTPNLDVSSICIGYRGKRTNKDKQMIIGSNYIEYKV